MPKNKKALEDYLRDNLDVIFCGCNPGNTSGALKSHFAYSTNSFWECLNSSGLLPKGVHLSYSSDFECLTFNVGLTNIVSKVTSGCNDLKAKDFREGSQELQQKIKTFRPKILCFVGMVVYRYYVKDHKSVFTWGLQELFEENEDEVGKLIKTLYYVVPSTSGRMAKVSRAEKIEWFRGLKIVLNNK